MEVLEMRVADVEHEALSIASPSSTSSPALPIPNQGGYFLTLVFA